MGRGAGARGARDGAGAFPDIHITVEDLLAEWDKVAARLTQRATHRGELLGIPPTGRQVTLTALVIVRIAHGKIAEACSEEVGWANKLPELAAG